jgi:RimJ/RimL family protein N-acetyltransferase
VGERERERLTITSGERVRIRHKHTDDAIQDYAWRRDPELTRYDGSPPVEPSFTRFLEQFKQEIAIPDPRRCSFAIETAEGEHIGNVMYYNADAMRQTAEIGISIGSAKHRGAGFGTEALVLFLRYMWNTLPIRVVELHTFDWNTRAQSAFRRAGFAPVARVYRSGRWYVRMEARREWWLHEFGDIGVPLRPTGDTGKI